MTQEQIDGMLASAADEKYRAFHRNIIRTSLPMWGVRAPVLQSVARKIARDAGNFFDDYEAENYEQILVYALALAKWDRPLEEKYPYLDKVMAKFDNWAHVDMTVSAFTQLRTFRENFLRDYMRLASGNVWERRFLTVFLMNDYMDEANLETVFSLFEKMQCDAYYVNMGIAWALSVGLVKHYERTVAFLRRGTLCDFIVHKTVQKARESYRISPERKNALLSLKRTQAAKIR